METSAPPQTPSLSLLLGRQNRDGGWPYASGVSWTEPTVYAIMAALAGGRIEEAERGLAWLRGMQRRDGGWAPQAGVEESTWVTALAVLLPAARMGETERERGVQWLLGMTGRESTRVQRLRQWMLGVATPPEQQFDGWPWFPGAAAWVGPTSLALLALRKVQQERPAPALAARIEDGRRFLIARMCKDGGWNHGSARALGYDGRPYPETTGMALAALAGRRSRATGLAIGQARRFLAAERSLDAQNWLKLGLLAHGAPTAGVAEPLACRTVRDCALALLVAEAEAGRNWILT
jgi:squalene cyclase